ncbi:MAG: GMC family oxidoreductase N-terminal domain-containing protein [Actinomycetota bacterium]
MTTTQRNGGAPMTGETFDYVVVGGGSAGSVVAGRLAAAGAEVLVLEAGGTDRRPDVLVPAALPVVYRTRNWRYRAEPDPSREGTVEAWPAGRILGGGGSINATVFIRGHAADYDGWAEGGCTGWDHASVLPLFRRMETWEGGADRYRGGDGPIHVAFQRTPHPGTDAFIAAAGQAGHPQTADYNGAQPDGVGVVQVNQRRGVRSHPSRRYLRGLARGRNLTVRTGALAGRIIFEGERAIGVEYRHRSAVHVARARWEVILCAGAIESPKLLMLSGVGSADELARHGIRPVCDSPGVGANLQDHAALTQRWHATVPTLNKVRPIDALRAVADYVIAGRGPLATTVWQAMLLHRTDPGLPAPNLQIAFSSFAVVNTIGPDGLQNVAPAKNQGFMVTTVLLHPRARGRISLRSSSPADPPRIDHAMFADADDLAELLAGAAEARRIMAQPAMTPLTSGMFEPEASCRTDGDWERLARRAATHTAHHSGTCRMGVDDLAVVDPELRVRGLAGLRVADASIMPALPSGNTNAAAILIGEKASDLLLAGRPADAVIPKIVEEV